MQPAIDMCRNGIVVSWTLAGSLAYYIDQITDPAMRRTFINPHTGEPWLEGDIYYRPQLADTLDKLAEAGDEGVDVFYRGEVLFILLVLLI